MPELFPGYCIDTNALIDLWRRFYPPDIFTSLWEKIKNLISRGELIAPREVFSELEKQDDELLKWVKRYRPMFKNLDNEQINLMREILRHFPNLIDAKKETPDADPFVIALAISKGWTVITSEKPASPDGPPKIPDVCENYNVKCIPLIEFFREQKWKF